MEENGGVPVEAQSRDTARRFALRNTRMNWEELEGMDFLRWQEKHGAYEENSV